MSGPTGSNNGNDGTTPMNDGNGSTPGGSKPLRAVGNQPAIAGAEQPRHARWAGPAAAPASWAG